MRLAIVGNRRVDGVEYTDYEFVKDNVNLEGVTEIVSGGAIGVDTLAERLADELGIEKNIIPITKEDWQKYGMRAGPIRNKEIVEACDAMVAFWDGKSNGTRDATKQAMKAGIPLKMILITNEPGLFSR